MATIQINSDNYRDHTETNAEGVSFLALGKKLPSARRAKALAQIRRRSKIRRQTRSKVPDVWGTLGMEGATGLDWEGTLHYSEVGNERSLPHESMPVTCKEIELIRRTIPEATSGNLRIIERYISFEDVTFGALPDTISSDEEIPRLRLTLMLGPDEGALVYYQLYPLKKSLTASDRDEVELEYLQPQPTPANRCQDRERLNYFIPMLSSRMIEENGENELLLSQAPIRERFVIKILTFKRENAEAASVIKRLHYHIWKHTHELVVWDPANGRFDCQDGSALRPDVKTLFLIHGTMSSTDIAFEGLLSGGTRSWIARMHGSKGGPYPQIIGFNHPTFSEDARMNAEALLDRLPSGFEFHGGVDLLTHSRGGLLGKYLALYCSPLHIRRGALVTCANGVGYFTAARHVARLLSVLRASTTAVPVLQGLMALAQHSAEFVLRLPGSQLMDPKSDRLEEVLESPSEPTPTFLPVVGDFSANLVAHRGFFRRWSERGLDLFLKLILRGKHDWVVGTKEQYILPEACYPPGWKPNNLRPTRIHTTRHSGYFVSSNGRVRNPAPARIERFLKTGTTWP
jgi:hypothetical protein